MSPWFIVLPACVFGFINSFATRTKEALTSGFYEHRFIAVAEWIAGALITPRQGMNDIFELVYYPAFISLVFMIIAYALRRGAEPYSTYGLALIGFLIGFLVYRLSFSAEDGFMPWFNEGMRLIALFVWFSIFHGANLAFRHWILERS